MALPYIDGMKQHSEDRARSFVNIILLAMMELYVNMQIINMASRHTFCIVSDRLRCSLDVPSRFA
jgi:hypothetical protein